MAEPAGHRVYLYAGCSTCRKAVAWLRERALPFESIDITTTPPSLALLGQALDQFGHRGRLFNTSGQSYRALGPATVKAMDDATALAALAADGRLIKRPFLVTASGRIVTGFQPREWEELFA
ncbi:Spx/MgsR family RNA polymerase-binding regulatory protein [Synechococcus sp. CCY 9618]|uniref:Spx/MgsR family RNA polymerase-binding regulatory protein n=1 Tax=Synechococcus sp. CCY 9618 TaxID=2815602 RepID=UPI001C249334|nr:Spx/MgsR family RNA polymerase-binding regulatory protein [Synechococcus sp. CCY 9618]